MPFKKGQSGNPGGKSKELKEIQAAAREHAPAALRTLARIATKGKTEAAQVRAAEALLDRGYGRPAQAHTGEDGGPIRLLVEGMTDDELARIAAGGRTAAPAAPDGSQEPG